MIPVLGTGCSSISWLDFNDGEDSKTSAEVFLGEGGVDELNVDVMGGNLRVLKCKFGVDAAALRGVVAKRKGEEVGR